MHKTPRARLRIPRFLSPCWSPLVVHKRQGSGADLERGCGWCEPDAFEKILRAVEIQDGPVRIVGEHCADMRGKAGGSPRIVRRGNAFEAQACLSAIAPVRPCVGKDTAGNGFAQKRKRERGCLIVCLERSKPLSRCLGIGDPDNIEAQLLGIGIGTVISPNTRKTRQIWSLAGEVGLEW